MQARAARLANPFGIDPPCDRGATGRPVLGYGEPDADVHVIGYHAGCHGGGDTGIPFTSPESGRQIREVLAAVGLLQDPTADEPLVDDLYLSYRYMCPVAPGTEPTPGQVHELERFFDAELRAVNAHILIPVGAEASDHVLAEYTTLFEKLPEDMDARHGLEVRGRGFLVVPMKDPHEWEPGDREAIVRQLRALLASDYRQTKGVATLVG